MKTKKPAFLFALSALACLASSEFSQAAVTVQPLNWQPSINFDGADLTGDGNIDVVRVLWLGGTPGVICTPGNPASQAYYQLQIAFGPAPGGTAGIELAPAGVLGAPQPALAAFAGINTIGTNPWALGPDVNAIVEAWPAGTHAADCVSDPPALNHFVPMIRREGADVYYGWLSIRSSTFAFNDKPNVPIALGVVPEPGSATFVGLASALAALKRRRARATVAGLR